MCLLETFQEIRKKDYKTTVTQRSSYKITKGEMERFGVARQESSKMRKDIIDYIT